MTQRDNTHCSNCLTPLSSQVHKVDGCKPFLEQLQGLGRSNAPIIPNKWNKKNKE